VEIQQILWSSLHERRQQPIELAKVVAVTGDQVFRFRSAISMAKRPPFRCADQYDGRHSKQRRGQRRYSLGNPATFCHGFRFPPAICCAWVAGIEMKEERIPASEIKQADQDAVLLINRVSRSLSTVPVGTLDAAGLFERRHRCHCRR